VFNDLKRSVESDEPTSSLLVVRVEPQYRSITRSISEGFLEESRMS
jgi:hypothetical protein